MIKSADFACSCSSVSDLPRDERPQIAFAGRSNVGKSSLLNKLVGRKRLAKTSKTPGRTRLLNFFLIDRNYYFVDLPGYGYARASHRQKEEWARLVDDYLHKCRNLIGLVFLIDCRREVGQADLMMYQWLQSRNISYVVVLTKADKLNRNKLVQKAGEISEILKSVPILFSARSGIGKKELAAWIQTIMENQPGFSG